MQSDLFAFVAFCLLMMVPSTPARARPIATKRQTRR
jgi:hypothetical protein